MARLVYSNPLPYALAHYELELGETLRRISVDAAPWPHAKSVESGGGRLSRRVLLGHALGNLRNARRSKEPVLQLWPSLGLLEARGFASKHATHAVVLHDP